MAGRDDQQFGNYRPIRLLDQENNADMYLGQHIHLNTYVVIKIQRAPLEGDELERFRARVRPLVGLTHPNLVHLLDFGVSHGCPYLVAQYVPGGTLRQRHPFGSRVPLGQVVGYVRQVASALHYIHEHKFIYQDIRPEHILVGERDQLLLDIFRLTVVPVHSPVDTQRSDAMTNKGSKVADAICYQAPEQIQGNAVPASDQYTLALVAYEWLTGGVSFRGSCQEVLAQQLALSPASLRNSLPLLPADVEQVIFKALAQEPRERFAGVELFARDLVRASSLGTSLQVSIPSAPVPSGEKKSLKPTLRGPTGRVVLDRPVVTLGRARDNVLILSDRNVSAYHAEVHLDGDACSLVDLASLNGTFVNGQLLLPRTPYLLQPEDSVLLGDAMLIFEWKRAEQLTGHEEEQAQPTQPLALVPTFVSVVGGSTSFVPGENSLFSSGHISSSVTALITPPSVPDRSLSRVATSPLLIPPPATPPITPPVPNRSARSRSWARLAALLSLIFVVLLSSGGGLLLFQHNNDVAQQHARATANARVVTQTTAYARASATAFFTSPYPPFTHLAFFDPLTHPNGNNTGVIWANNELNGCQFTNLGYLVSIAIQSHEIQCFAVGTDYHNFAYQVTMTMIQGDCGGLIFRRLLSPSIAGFYRICWSGNFQVSVETDKSILASLGVEHQEFSTAIRRGAEQVNTIAVVANDTQLTFYANGVRIGQLNNTALTDGAIGVMATDDTNATSVRYTNALLWTQP